MTKDSNMQVKNLGKVYSWYFRKLESIGQLSGQEKDEEEMLLNPGKIEELENRKREQQELKRMHLLDEEITAAKSRQRFDRCERSIHRDIAPAKDRVTGYKTKCFGRLFTGIAAARDKSVDESARPPTSSTSINNQAEMTTQA
jgi:hypothetical protein